MSRAQGKEVAVWGSTYEIVMRKALQRAEEAGMRIETGRSGLYADPPKHGEDVCSH